MPWTCKPSRKVRVFSVTAFWVGWTGQEIKLFSGQGHFGKWLQRRSWTWRSHFY